MSARCRLAQRHLDPDHRGARLRPDLHQVAKLLDKPQAAAVQLPVAWSPPTDQGIGDVPRVGHFAHQVAAVGPELEAAPGQR